MTWSDINTWKYVISYQIWNKVSLMVTSHREEVGRVRNVTAHFRWHPLINTHAAQL